MRDMLRRVIALSAICSSGMPAPGAINSNWTGDGNDGLWSTGSNWAPETVPNNDGMNTFDVTITGAGVNVGAPIEIDSLALVNGAGVVGAAQFDVLGTTTVDLGVLEFGQYELTGPVLVSRGLELTGGNVMAPGGITIGTGGANGGLDMNFGAMLELGGALTLLKDGNVSDTSENGTGTPVINSDGATIQKSGGTGLSTVTVRIDDTGGQIQGSSGLLQFQSANLNGTAISATAPGKLQFNGPTTLSGTIAVTSPTTATSDSVRFSGGTHTLAGTLTASGGGEVLVTNNAAFGGGMLNCPSDTPLIFDNAMIGAGGKVTNQGRTEWKRGTVTGGGFENAADAELFLPFKSTFDRTVSAGTLTNNGFTQIDKAITLGADGQVVNNEEWVIGRGNANIGVSTGAEASAMFTNNKTLAMDPDVAASAILFAPFESVPGSRIDVLNGDLRLHGTAPERMKLTGCFVTVEGTNASTWLSIGQNGLSRSTCENVSFSMNGGGQARFLGGTHELKGQMVSGGTGKIEVNAATLRPAAGQSVELIFDQTAPLILNSTNAEIDATTTVTNKDWLVSRSGAIVGAGEFINARSGVVDVEDFLRISRGTGGTFRNQGSLRLSGTNFEGVSIDSNGALLNDPNASIIIMDAADIVKQSGSAGGTVMNRGQLLKLAGAGESLITGALFQQEGDGAQLGCDVGTLRLFTDDIQLLGGKLSSVGNNAKVLIQDSSTTQDVAFEFGARGTVEYSSINANTLHELSGTLEGDGQGRLRHTGGLMRSQSGAQLVLEFGDEDPENDPNQEAVFEQVGGVFGETGSQVANRGNFRSDGGAIEGNFTNVTDRGFFALRGGNLRDNFLNNSDFVWTGGRIDATFTNNATEGRAMTLAGSFIKRLDQERTLTSNGKIFHTGAGALEMGHSSRLVVAGEYHFGGGGDITRNFVGIPFAKMIVTGKVANPGAISSSINVKVESTGGSFETTDAQLAVNGFIGEQDGEPEFNGGFFRATTSGAPFAGLLTTSFAKLGGGLTHELTGEARIEHTRPTIDATLTATGTGTVELKGSECATGSSYNLVAGANAIFELTAAHNVAAAATANGGLLRFLGTTFKLVQDGNAGSFDADADLELDDLPSTPTTLAGPDSGTFQSRVPFVSRRTARQVSATDVRFDGAFEFQNLGTYDLTRDSGIGNGTTTTADDLLLHNMTGATLCKSGGFKNSFATISVPVRNDGKVQVKQGNLRMSNCLTLDGGHLTGGTWIVDPNGTLDLNLTTPITENDGTVTINGGVFKNFVGGADLENDGTFTVTNGSSVAFSGEFENNGTTTIGAGSTLTVGTLDNDGTLTVNGDLIYAGGANVQTGTTKGSGAINGTQVTSRGTTCPGNSPGILTYNAELIQDPNALIQIELAGTTAGAAYDVLVVNGPLTLAGTLDVVLLDDFVPGSTDEFTVITATSRSGTFDNTPTDPNGVARLTTPAGSFEVRYTATGVVLAGFVPAADCVGDIDGSGEVGLDDLLLVLAAFGDPGPGSPGDADGDGDADLDDLLIVLGAFGLTCG